MIRPGPKTAVFLERQTTAKELSRLLTGEDDTRNTSAGATVMSCKAGREVVAGIRTVRSVTKYLAAHKKRSGAAKQLQADHRVSGNDPAGSSVYGRHQAKQRPPVNPQISKIRTAQVRERRIGAGQAGQRKTGMPSAAAGTGGKAAGHLRHLRKPLKLAVKNTGAATVDLLRTSGTTDSSAGSIHMTFQTRRIACETVSGLKTTVKGGRAIYHYVGQRRARRKQVIAEKEKIMGSESRLRTSARGQRAKVIKARKQKQRVSTQRISGMRLKAVVEGLGKKAAQAALAHPGVLLVAAGLGLLLLIIVSISSSAGGMVPAQFVIADQEVMDQYTAKIEELDAAFQQRIDDYKNTPGYDDVRIEFMGEEGELKTNWVELLSLLAVKFEQDLTFSQAEQEYLKELHSMMRTIVTRTERYTCGGCCSCGEGGQHCHGHIRLIVTVNSLGMEDIIAEIGFDDAQMDWARNLAVSDWPSLYGIAGADPGGGMSPDDIRDIIASAPVASATRQEIRSTALSLVGKVDYFWGGKSAAGWNPRWGSSVKVTAPGSSSSGTYQPYGLDCSGFVDWVYKTAGIGNIFSGGGTGYQWGKTFAISSADLLPGDLVFLSIPGTNGKNHVGIFVGRENGKNLYCHCAWSQGVVVNSYAGFKYYRRPLLNFGD